MDYDRSSDGSDELKKALLKYKFYTFAKLFKPPPSFMGGTLPPCPMPAAVQKNAVPPGGGHWTPTGTGPREGEGVVVEGAFFSFFIFF